MTNNLTVDNSKFDPNGGFHRGKALWIEVIWHVVRAFFFMSSLPWPSSLKRVLLISFGANVGKGFYIRPRVCIHFPWKLVIGDNCWIGDDCGLLNLEPIVIGNNVAIAHRVYLATGNHDFTDHTMGYRNRKIEIEDGVWIASCAFIGPGVKLGSHAVVSAGAVVTKDVASWSIVRGNPCAVVGVRKIRK